MRSLLLILLAATTLTMSLRAQTTDGAAWILLYHHVSNTTPEATSVTPARFDEHLDFLARNDYRVVALSEVVARLSSGELDSRSVAITFDDAYKSVYTEAFPRLRERGWPFTIFVNTDAVDRNSNTYVSWAELREMEQAGASVGNHSRRHAHLAAHSVDESSQQWRARVSADIVYAQQRLAAELTRPLQLFAYPYGEFTPELKALVRDLGYRAFGQQSGPVGRGVAELAIPRIPIAHAFADLASLGEKLRTRHLPVRVLQPASPVLQPIAVAPTLELQIAAGPFDLSQLACYVSNQGRAQLSFRTDQPRVVRVKAAHALPVGRSKYTCTAPATNAPGVYYWYSHLWLQPKPDGSWYDE